MKCPICNSRQLLTRRDDLLNQTNSFIACQNCGHNFCSLTVPEELHESYNADTMFGGNNGSEMPDWFSPLYHSGSDHLFWLKNMMKSFGCENGSLLDIGCGCGDLLNFFDTNSDFTCFGNDIVHKACNVVREKFDFPVFEGAFTAKLVGNQRFDVIITTHVIEHLNKPDDFVRDIKAVCNKGALVVVMCPNDDSLTARFKRTVLYPAGLTGEYGYLHFPMHLQGYTPASIKHLFESAGMTTEAIMTLSKSQKIFGRRLEGVKEYMLYPLFLTERIFNMGSVLCAFFRV